MVQSQLFSSGVEVASSVVSSGLLRRSWNVITSPDIDSHPGNGLSWKVCKEQDTNVTIIAFEATLPDISNLQADLVSSAEFLHFEKKPLFALNRTASSLFFHNKKSLDQLKYEVNDSLLVIVTGLALGGSIASLFTLSLLDSIDLVPKEKDKIDPKKIRLCITFGSPLIGDKDFQETISHSSSWNSCFLHVVSNKDSLPRRFITNHTASASRPSPNTSSYLPFGTFLLCSESDTYSTCLEDPESILVLLKASVHDQNQVFQSLDYGKIVESLYERAICKVFTAQNERINHSNSIHASISLQLRALGWMPPHMQNTFVNTLETIETNSINQKRTTFDPSKKLNLMKIDMAQLEQFKMKSKYEKIGYYDSYKILRAEEDQDVVGFHRKLNIYWENKVIESMKKPQKEGAYFRFRWLGAGTNYRRMVEPLAIAEYYRGGSKDYVKNGRSNHFNKLEEWLIQGITEATGALSNTGRKNVEVILTLDSCFWAHVEEALLSYEQLSTDKSSVLEKEEAANKLLQFENYVYGQLMNYAVSPEVFLEKSSYMKWWNQYKAIKRTDYSTALTRFMSNADNYNVEYAGGTYKFD